MARPMTAYLLIRSLNNPTILIIRAIGGAKITMIPPRNPNTVPHVAPETFNIAGSIGNQGTIARAIPTLPNSADCFSCIILKTVCIKFHRMGRCPCPCVSLFTNYQFIFIQHGQSNCPSYKYLGQPPFSRSHKWSVFHNEFAQPIPDPDKHKTGRPIDGNSEHKLNDVVLYSLDVRRSGQGQK
jgi:hypothetical protein